jgi:hypothetical protein
LHLAVIVAVVAVRMMQVTVYKIIGMVTVWNSRVATAGSVLVGFLMTAAIMAWRASGRVRGVDS